MQLFYKNTLVCFSVCYIAVLILLLISCGKNTKKEVFDGGQAISDLTSSQTDDAKYTDDTSQVDNDDTIISTEDTDTTVIHSDAIVFSPEYGTVQRWNNLAFAQEDAQIKALITTKETSLLSLITRNTLVEDNRVSVITPYDTIIGKLQNIKTGDTYDMAIYDLWENVIEQIKSGSLDKNMQQYVIESEIPIISRQIAYANKYGSNITSFRMGEVATEAPNERYMRTRIFASLPDFDSQAELIVYVLSVEGRWYISAIEGNFDDLLVAYQPQGQFEPAGTLGVTHGL